MSSWTDKQIEYINKMRSETDLMWDDITDLFNDKFDENRTKNAVRKSYKRFNDNDTSSDDTLLKNIKSNITAKKRATKLAKENKVILESHIFESDFLKELDAINKKCPIKLHKNVKLKKKKKHSRTIVAHLSDTHIGVNIKRKEMGGINEFNPTVAARRFAFFFKTLSQYKIDHRDETDLVIVLNGDIFAGVIHGLEGGVLPMSTQFSLGMRIFSEGISFISQYFSKVKIVGLTGNHDRYMHKDNKGRQSDQKWDSFATNLYVALDRIFKDYKNITFDIPSTPYATFKIQGHSFFATHGDTVLNLGNPGKSINTGSITKQVNNISIGLKENIDVVMAAHVHKSTFQALDNGSSLVINGTLSGTDAFAQSIGILSNNPIQQMFEVTPDHQVGDMRFVRLESADKDESLDKIIEPQKELF